MAWLYFFKKRCYSQTQFASVKFIASTIKGPKKPAGGQIDKTPALVPNICVCWPRGELYVRLNGGEPVKVASTFVQPSAQMVFWAIEKLTDGDATHCTGAKKPTSVQPPDQLGLPGAPGAATGVTK